MALVDQQLLTGLEDLNHNKNSYEYLKSFLDWWENKNTVNIRMARILYPYVFFSSIFGVGLMEVEGSTLGSILLDRILDQFPNIQLVFGLPLIGIIGAFIIASLLLYFSEKIYRLDINLVYGPVIRKIEGLVKDMEELRNDPS